MENSEKSVYPIERLESEKGITKREYFTGIVLKSILTKYSVTDKSEMEALPEICVFIADKILKELDKKWNSEWTINILQQPF